MRVERVAEVRLTASLKITETGGKLIVSGPYDQMKSVYPSLKRWGFKFDGFTKAWWIASKDVTPDLRSKVNDLIQKAGPAPEVQREAQKLIEDALKLDLVGFRITSQTGGAILLTGETYDIRNEAVSAGGTWNSNGYVFRPDTLKPSEFRKLVRTIETRSDKFRELRDAVAKLIGPGKNWVSLGVSIHYQPSMVIVRSKSRDFNDEIKRMGLRWNPTASYWEAPARKVDRTSLSRFLDLMDKKDQEALKQGPPKIPNRKGGPCEKCGGNVLPGEGLAYQEYDDIEGDFVWRVEHRDPKKCEQILTERKERARLLSNRNEARRKLRDYAIKHNKTPPGKHRPRGETIWIADRTSQIYGGGTWVVVEPDEKHFWYVQNNGRDGADWSLNNVDTGGAGAIGWRVPMTDEARLLIETAQV